MNKKQHVISIIATVYIWYSIISRVLLTTTFVSDNVKIARVFGLLALAFRGTIIMTEVIAMIRNRVRIYHFFNLGILTVLALGVYANTGDWVMFDVFFFLFCFSKYLSAERVYALISKTLFFSIAIISLMSILHIIPTEVYSRGEEKARYTFGFNHPNAIGGHVLYLVIFYVLSKKKISIKDAAIAFLGAGFAYVFPNSISSSMCLIIIGFCILAYKYDLVNCLRRLLKDHHKLFNVVLFFLLSLVVCIYLFAFSDGAREYLAGISGTFYRRFLYGKWAYERFGFSICGQHVDMVNDKMLLTGSDNLEYFNIDCTYFYFPVVLGILPTIYYIYWYIKGIYVSIQTKKYTLLFMLLIVALSGATETTMIYYLGYLLVGVPIYENKKSFAENSRLCGVQT